MRSWRGKACSTKTLSQVSKKTQARLINIDLISDSTSCEQKKTKFCQMDHEFRLTGVRHESILNEVVYNHCVFRVVFSLLGECRTIRFDRLS